MKRFLLQSLCVILIIAAIKVYKYRRHFEIFYPKDRIRAQALVPRAVSLKRDLPCGVMGNIPVVFGSDEILVETAGHNIKYLMGHWDTIWPVLEKALLKEMRDYDKEQYMRGAKPILTVAVPQQIWSEQSEWWIVMGFEPFNGIWTVEMVGSKNVKDVSVAF